MDTKKNMSREQLLAYMRDNCTEAEAQQVRMWLRERLKEYGEAAAAAECGVGLPTLRDIVGELLKPGRDPRDELPKPILRTDVLELKDLKPGMELTGTVRNVIDFGVFVDIGVHQDGLVHISQIADKRVEKVTDYLQMGQEVPVKVLEVDRQGRIRLSIKEATEQSQPAAAPEAPAAEQGE